VQAASDDASSRDDGHDQGLSEAATDIYLGPETYLSTRCPPSRYYSGRTSYPLGHSHSHDDRPFCHSHDDRPLCHSHDDRPYCHEEEVNDNSKDIVGESCHKGLAGVATPDHSEALTVNSSSTSSTSSLTSRTHIPPLPLPPKHSRRRSSASDNEIIRDRGGAAGTECKTQVRTFPSLNGGAKRNYHGVAGALKNIVNLGADENAGKSTIKFKFRPRLKEKLSHEYRTSDRAILGAQRRERKATKTLAIVLGKCLVISR